MRERQDAPSANGLFRNWVGDADSAKSPVLGLRFAEYLMPNITVLEVDLQTLEATWHGDVDAWMNYPPGGFPRRLENLGELVHPEDLPRIAAIYQEWFDAGGRGQVEFRYRLRAGDGSYRRVISRGDEIQGRRMFGMIIDVTEQVQAEERLAESLQHLRARDELNNAILSAIGSKLAVIDEDGQIILTNPAWSCPEGNEPLEEPKGSGVGANYLEVCRRATTEDARVALAGIESVLLGSRSHFEMTYECSNPSEQRWYKMTVTPRKPHGAVVLHTDITSDVQTTRDLEQALEEVDRLRHRMERESDYLRHEVESKHGVRDVVGESGALHEVLRKVGQVAPTNASVLLFGETGTGKEVIARAIHGRSQRRDRLLVKVDCGSLPPTLIEAELFGHEKGAYTGAHKARAGHFELADGATIFLDEIGELPLELQTKLLRVLEDGRIQRLGDSKVRKVDVRVLCATNRNLEKEVEEGRFRADLYYRLGVFPIALPALRDRREDIPALARFFVKRCGPSLHRRIDHIPERTLEELQQYHWPGNIRELRNVIERAIITSPGRDLLLSEQLGTEPAPARRDLGTEDGFTLPRRPVLERDHILRALEASDWKVKGDGNAASLLGLNPSTLRSRMKRLGIVRPKSAGQNR